VLCCDRVRGAHAAGKLSAFFWDHPVPSVPPAMRKLCEAWAAKEKIDLQLDFVSSIPTEKKICDIQVKHRDVTRANA